MTTAYFFVMTATFISHWWMMLFAKKRLGSERSDKSHDPLYSHLKSTASFLLLLIAQIIFMGRLSLILLDAWPPLPILSVIDVGSLPPQWELCAFSALIYSIGFALRIWAIRTLGNFFTFEIGIRDQHEILEMGPYRWLRHPSYTGYIFMILGLGILYGSLPLGAVFLVCVCGFLTLRIIQEEKMLVSHFGQKYISYQKRSKRLIPFIF